MKKLEVIMKSKRIKASELFKLSGVKHPTIYNYLNGRQKDLYLSTAGKLADALGIDVNELREE